MGDEHPHAELVREAFEAMDRGEPEQFADLLADDVEWHEVGSDQPIRGKQAVIESFQGGDFEIEADIHDILANDDHTIVLLEATGKRDGATLDYRTVEILHVDGGKITSRWSYARDPQAVRDFFS